MRKVDLHIEAEKLDQRRKVALSELAAGGIQTDAVVDIVKTTKLTEFEDEEEQEMAVYDKRELRSKLFGLDTGDGDDDGLEDVLLPHRRFDEEAPVDDPLLNDHGLDDTNILGDGNGLDINLSDAEGSEEETEADSNDVEL